MSIVILGKGSNIDQYSKFIDHLGNDISNWNSSSEKKVDQNEFSVKATQFLQANDLSGLITHILSLGDVLINDARAAASSFIILSLIASKIEKKDQQNKSVNDLISYVMKRDQSQTNLKFKLLSSIFNTLPDNQQRCEAFKNILKLADDNNKPNILLVHLMNIDEYVSAWGLSKDQEIEVFRSALHLINKANNKYYKERHQVYLKFLRALDAKFDQDLFNKNKADIENIILTILTTFPDHVDFNNILILKPITEVKNSNKPLYDLFEIALNGDYQEFSDWNTKNTGFLKNHKIDEQKIIDRCRLRSFFKLAETKKVLKITEVQKALNLTEVEAEFWIIRALQSGHIEGKIDQLESNFTVDGINDTSFKATEWKQLESRLDSFKKKFEGLLENLKKDNK